MTRDGAGTRAPQERHAVASVTRGSPKMEKNRKKQLALWSLGVIALMLIGCATPQQKAQTLTMDHPDWPEQMIQQVAAGQVAIGMTPDMVAAALGKRGDSSFDDRTGEEVWTYYRGYYEYEYGAVWVPVYWVYFKNDLVVGTEGDRKEVFTW